MDIYNLDWIKKNFPKVWNILQDYIVENGTTGVRFDLNASEMMYFFDSQGLYIGIIADPDGLEFFTDISAIPIGMSPTRKEAEEKVIIEAMRTLTEILDGQK